MSVRKNIYFDEKEYEKLQEMKEKYGLKSRTYFMETFGMMDEGKGNGGRASR